MSTARSRMRTQNLSGHYTIAGHFMTAYENSYWSSFSYPNVVNDSGIDVQIDSGVANVRESISDYVGGRCNKNVSHTKEGKSYISGSQLWVGNLSSGTLTEVVTLKGTCGLTSSIATGFSGLKPSISWVDVLVDMGSQILGQLQSGFDLGEDLATWNQTARMISKSMSGLAKNWRYVAGSRSAKQLAKLGSNVWLEGRYGWIPLYSDICALAAAHYKVRSYLKRQSNNTGLPLKLCASRTQSFSPQSFTEVTGANKTSTYIKWEPLGSNVVQTLVGHIDRRSVPNTSTFDAYLQYFGLQNPVRVLYELCPFSFVADWFINSKMFLNQRELQACASASVHDATSSTKWEIKGRPHVLLRDGPMIERFGTSTARTPVIGDIATYTEFNRSVGWPSYSITDLALGAGITTVHVADAAALFIQRA